MRKTSVSTAKSESDSSPSSAQLNRDGTRRRLRVWEIRGYVECSLVGTCLCDGDLRKTLKRCKIKFPDNITTYDLHGYYTQQIKSDNIISRAVQKLLDRRHEGIVHRVGKTESADLKDLWDKEFAAGRIPGAYWAFQTHNHIPDDLDYRIFGEVHMLSHVLGRTVHATAAKASEFQARISDLEEKLMRNGRRHQEALLRRDNEINTLKIMLATVKCSEALTPALDYSKLKNLKHTTKHERALTIARQRARQAEAKVVELEKLLHEQRKLNIQKQLAQHEVDTVQSCPGACACRLNLKEGENLKILYVGGRISSVNKLRNIAKAASAEFFHHDGGRHQSLSRINDLVSQCHIVFCPMNCVSHRACLHAKSTCHRCNKAFVPLRSSGGTTFARALERIEIET
ncbi:MAG: DUF2325 domain-containing protein [Pseudomonadota bacterium]